METVIPFHVHRENCQELTHSKLGLLQNILKLLDFYRSYLNYFGLLMAKDHKQVLFMVLA